MTRTMHVTDPCHGQVITLDHVGFDYEGQKVFENVNFTVRERDFVGVIGANGAGKTTLLRLMVGLLRPTAGEVKLFGTPIQRFKQWERVGYVPQKNSFNPLFPATVMEVVQSGMYNRRRMFRRLSKQEISQCVDAMAAMRIENLAHKKIGQLSGGQQQRVFLARAMVNKPDLMILDEPTVGIDAGTQKEFFSLLQHLHAHHRMTFVMVSHDLDLVNSWLGDEPAGTCGNFHFYVKHSHEAECLEPGLTHGVIV
ncbi:metal ABC transporter ATP-binding protein [Paenibacillus melissococcoides]|uniref:Metal ABC transporter ATP-binding protein n=1 Tax=Paenibacillus melissococcoides TaxID=2912268 RepID=A0ABN8U7U4_9BACL|nr:MULTISPECIES: metal ABC transporter ATP-binding protein [Paenibacillus]MEB9894703.1 metal ABC transporter ATP-binding protein [Bacillus cereus]CAH8245502.1 metal ABC transporter ATP-binding protein [Paenibacillus melissococcoides]CAH8711135.1 metal ABC transporter ATP-binding protein [Paenibacillus melissococcoides]CAH8711902.1 metal ABC transporter ATP-binding protein [Paenibacillus melissococcoides]GIO78627.1 zinc uptake system ATP-binding protein ZurA [Paenibacillus dendritiformis]